MRAYDLKEYEPTIFSYSNESVKLVYPICRLPFIIIFITMGGLRASLDYILYLSLSITDSNIILVDGEVPLTGLSLILL